MGWRPSLIVFLLASMAGMVFAGFSTADFVEHLDRQVHSIHCSFIPGLAAPENGASDCKTTLMSPYSSVFRATIWGGIPVSLPGLAVFSFLLFRGLDLVLNRRRDDKAAAGFLLAATGVPVLTSLGMGYLSLVELGAACKLCIGIYSSSVVCAIAAFLNYREVSTIAAEPVEYSAYGEVAAPTPVSAHILSFVVGVGFVVVPVLVYALMVPDHGRFVGTCGTLAKPGDEHNIMVDLDGNTGGAPTIEVFDPLCPACKGFERRLEASGLSEKLDRKAVLFPLDNTCNWMIGSTMHPGACAVSEAVLCAGDKAAPVVDWAFEHQDEIREKSAADPAAAEKMVKQAFPDLASCVGSTTAKTRLNRSLRWAVANQIPVLTPQIYVNNQKLCDEDTDLGMDFALTRLLELQAGASR